LENELLQEREEEEEDEPFGGGGDTENLNLDLESIIKPPPDEISFSLSKSTEVHLKPSV